ncbi:hypothetical protein [Deinococcus sp.]|uniref:hypothetical protein n=1 Tax=Deinococcus sp. TaxID=47478 RepID=UPI003B5CBFF7
MSNPPLSPTFEPAPPALPGGRSYWDFSDLPDCVSVRVSVNIYADESGADAANAGRKPNKAGRKPNKTDDVKPR